MAGMQGQPSTTAQQQPPPIIVSIPMRGERGAPTVNINKPRMLIRFFKELEMIFTKAGVTAEADKKDMVVQYVDMELEDVWSSYPEFKDQTKSYINFKDTIIRTHLGSSYIHFTTSMR